MPNLREFLTSLKPTGPQGQPVPEDGRWLSAEGPYRDYVAAYCELNPNLRTPDPKNRWTPLETCQARVSMLELEVGKQARRTDFATAVQLSQHLKRSSRESGKQICRLYIMEGRAPDYIAALGGRFLIDPILFMGQERTTRWGLSFEGSRNTPALPSLMDSWKPFTIKYYEPRNFHEIKSFSMWCARTSRNISVTRNTRPDLHDLRYEPIGIIHHKCSFWLQNLDNGSWDAVILCDPPVEDVFMQLDHSNIDRAIRSRYSRWMSQKPIKQKAPNRPFFGGYPDFVKHAEFGHDVPKGPPRTSMLEDICFYWTQYGDKLDGSLDPAFSKLFMHKIVASHYMQLLEFARASVANLEFQLSRRDSLKNIHIPWVEAAWSDLQAWSWRCSEYIEQVEAILVSLGVPFSATPHQGQSVDWKSCDTDFQHIHYRFRILKKRVDIFIQSITGLAGIAGNGHALLGAKRSLKETMRMKTISVLGMIFLPLAFCTGLFSMNEKYLPGTSTFWIYLAVSIPLILIVFLVNFLIGLGYDGEGLWSKETLIRNLKKWRIHLADWFV